MFTNVSLIKQNFMVIMLHNEINLDIPLKSEGTISEELQSLLA